MYLDVNGNLNVMMPSGTIKPVGDSSLFTAGSISAGPLNCANGLFQALTMASNSTLASPTNGVLGMKLEIWLSVLGSTNLALNLDSGITLPSDSSLTLPKTLTAGKMYIMKLWYNGTNWMLVSLVGGY